MRKFIILIILIPFVIPACKDKDNCPSEACEIPPSLAKNVLAFYPFSNGSIDDFSGNKHHLNNSTTAHSSSDRAGNTACAFEFDNIPNSTEFLRTDKTSFLDSLDEFTISLWYEPLDLTRNGGTYEGLVQRDTIGNDWSQVAQWSIGLFDVRKATFCRTNAVWDKSITNGGNELETRTDQWHHLVATYNSNGIEMSLYRNGVFQEQVLGDYKDLKSLDKGDLLLGLHYTGKIDDIIIFNKSLNQTQVDSLYNMKPCCLN